MQSKGKKDDGKGRTCFQEVSLPGSGHGQQNGQHGMRGRSSHKPSTSLDENPKHCSFAPRPPAHKMPTLLSEELAVLGQLQLQLISIISLIRKLLLQPSHLELRSLQDVAHGGGWRT